MSALLILVIAVVALALGYVFYGSWLAKQWGVDPNRETPAHTSFDNKDFVPANPAVLMGHHFSSIAGAGPINGPIQAAVFGWVPVFLLCGKSSREQCLSIVCSQSNRTCCKSVLSSIYGCSQSASRYGSYVPN